MTCLEDEFFLLWEMMPSMGSPLPTAPGTATHWDSTGMPSILPPSSEKNCSDPFIFLFLFFFLTLKKWNFSQATSSRDESVQPRSQRRENNQVLSASVWG